MDTGDEKLPREDPTDIGGRPQDDYVNRRRPQPADAAPGGLTISGVLGDSDRAGFRRLYLRPGLDRWIEFATADVIDVSDIPPDFPPFIGEKATSVTLRPRARIDFTQTHSADELDIEFSSIRVPEAQWGWVPPELKTVFCPPWPPWWTHRWWCPW